MQNPLGGPALRRKTLALLLCAATAALGLVSTETAASAATSPTGKATVGADTPLPPPGVSAELEAGPPVIIQDDDSGTTGFVGYLICLINDPNSCLYDTAGTGTSDPNSLPIAILGNVIADVIVWGIQAKGATVIKIVKKYLFNTGTHRLYAAPDSGLCNGAWGDYTDVTYGSCDSAHGIYWQWNANGDLWNTYSAGDMVVNSDSVGQSVYVGAPGGGDWSRWGYEEVCSGSC